MRSGIMLTLEGPGGPSSVELSEADCIDLADAVAALAGSLDRTLLERFPPGSAVATWVLAATISAATRAGRSGSHAAVAGGAATLPGGDVEESSRNAAMLTSLQGSLSATSEDVETSAGRLLLRIVALAAETGRQRESFEREVVEARIESMKQLAYGAGHEINNPLANIATRAQSLLPAERDPERRRRLAAIIDQAFRARDMIGGLMLFARPPKPVRREVAAQSIVAAAVEAVDAAALTRGVRIVVDGPAREVVGDWDSSQLEEALRAVLTNAIEAGRGGGEVRICVEMDESVPDTCRVRVVDDGPGMDRETLARAFDPFFSGREAGRGIGLGLSKVWRLVEINGGRTTIESRYGVGTTVSILLPISCQAGTHSGRRVDASSPV